MSMCIFLSAHRSIEDSTYLPTTRIDVFTHNPDRHIHPQPGSTYFPTILYEIKSHKIKKVVRRIVWDAILYDSTILYDKRQFFCTTTTHILYDAWQDFVWQTILYER